MSTGEQRTIRKLAAIVVADVMHYSRQMEADEVGTLARLKSLRTEILDPVMRAHDGRLVKLMGDGLLAEFASAVDATEWALATQRAIAERNAPLPEAQRMTLRIGVNVGDVILEGDDIYGDGVNVAARLEPLAPGGGICISAAVHDHVQGRVDAEFVARGEHTVKNIVRPISIFCWSPSATASQPGRTAPGTAAAAQQASTSPPARPRGRKPILAVLPFDAAGDNADAAFLASAVHEATIASMANLSGITVLADSTRADYVASGTIQAVGRRYRAMVRLVDNRSGERFWSDRFDGDLSELFGAEDELAYRVSTALRFSVYDREVAEMEKIPEAERTTEMILARIGQTLAGANREEWEEAGPKLDAIIASDPADAGPHAMKASWYLREVFYGWRELDNGNAAEAVAECRLALRYNPRSDFVHMVASLVHLYCEKDADKAQRAAERALELSPFYAIGRYMQGLAMIFGGQAEAGLAICANTILASPRMVMNHRIMQGAALGAFLAGRFDEAVDWAKRSDHQAHDVAPTLLILAAAAAAAGRDDEARATTDRLLACFPDLRLGAMRRWPFRDAADHDRFTAALAAAGLPS